MKERTFGIDIDMKIYENVDEGGPGTLSLHISDKPVEYRKNVLKLKTSEHSWDETLSIKIKASSEDIEKNGLGNVIDALRKELDYNISKLLTDYKEKHKEN